MIAFDDPGVSVHAMSKKSVARVTRRTVEELEEAEKLVPATAYDIHSFASLGALYKLLTGIKADHPEEEDVQRVKSSILCAIEDTC
jgi:malonate decarboxylase beta subunit